MQYHIPIETAQAIRRLDDLGWSQRQIARRLQLSTTTVHRVLHGRWSPTLISDDPFWEQRLSAKRCSGCGGLVYQWPCRACEVRALVDRQALRPAA